MINSSRTEILAETSLSDVKNYFFLFIIWPFLSFILALINFSKKEARKVVYIFIVYFGLTFVNSNTAVDSYRYALSLKATSMLPFSDFFKIIGGLYSDTSVDIIEPLISFLISRISSDAAIYFGVWAAFFGYFYLKSISLLYERCKINHGWNTIILLTFFAMIIPVTMISGVRMWTAAWIFFYGAFRAVTEKEFKFLFIALSSSLVHWSFITANLILVIYFFAGNRNVIFIPLALASFIVPRLAGSFFSALALKAGGGLQQRYSSYSSEAYINVIQESAAQSAWFMRIANDLVLYYLLFAVVIIQFKHRTIVKDKKEKNLFSFLILFLAFVNFGMPIPSFGERFMLVFFLFVTAYLLLYFSKLPGNKLYYLMILGIFPMFLYSLINFRIGSEHISAWLFSPCLGIPFLSPVLSLSEILFN